MTIEIADLFFLVLYGVGCILLYRVCFGGLRRRR